MGSDESQGHPGPWGPACDTGGMEQQAISRVGGAAAGTLGPVTKTVETRLGRQPTPASVPRAKQDARADVEATLAQAERYDTQGRARLMLNP